MSKHHVYVYMNQTDGKRSIYIGKANDRSRIYEPHNADAERLRDMDGTVIWSTSDDHAFSGPDDALTAEAILIRVVSEMLSGPRDEIFTDEDDAPAVSENEPGTLTNRASVRHSSRFSEFEYVSDEEVDYGTLTETAIVYVTPDKRDDRSVPRANAETVQFTDQDMARIRTFWGLGSAEVRRRAGVRVSEVMAIRPNGRRILGRWQLDPEHPFVHECDQSCKAEECSQKYNSFNTVDNDPLPGSWGGKLIVPSGVRFSQTVNWSGDIRAQFS